MKAGMPVSRLHVEGLQASPDFCVNAALAGMAERLRLL